MAAEKLVDIASCLRNISLGCHLGWGPREHSFCVQAFALGRCVGGRRGAGRCSTAQHCSGVSSAATLLDMSAGLVVGWQLCS
jgi:hypothetical protein